jgi:hypothetical protein
MPSRPDPSEIVARAVAVLNALRASPTWHASLNNAVVASPPLLVTSIAPAFTAEGVERRLPDYFIVTIRKEAGISSRFAHDADSGDLLEAEGVRKAGAVLPPYVDPDEVLRPEMPEATLPSPVVVWRPCRESTSRFLPFWRYQIDGQSLYVRADGMTFAELTTTGRG